MANPETGPIGEGFDTEVNSDDLNLQIGQLWREIRRGAAATRLSDYIYREGPDGMDIGLIRVIEACVALGPCRAVDLAAFMDVTPSTVSRSLSRLETMGFVQRHEADDDRRAVEVEVTTAGQARHDLFARRAQFAVQQILGGYSADDRIRLANEFRDLIANIDSFLDEHEGQRLPDS